MGDRSAGVGHEADIVPRRPVHPRMLVDENRVAEDCVRPQDADLVGPLDRRHAGASRHFVELNDTLRRVYLERPTLFLGQGHAVLQQLRRTGVDLGRHDHGAEAAARVSLRGRDEIGGVFERAPPGGLVPFVFDQVTILGDPAGRAIHRCRVGAHAACGHQIHPAVVDHGQIDDGGDPAHKKFAIGHRVGRLQGILLALLQVHGVGRQKQGLGIVETAHVKLGVADFLDNALADRFRHAVGMDVDQARHDEQVAAIDLVVGGTVVALANEGNGVAGEHHIRVAQVTVRRSVVVPGGHPSGVSDANGRGHFLPPPRYCFYACYSGSGGGAPAGASGIRRSSTP